MGTNLAGRTTHTGAAATNENTRVSIAWAATAEPTSRGGAASDGRRPGAPRRPTAMCAISRLEPAPRCWTRDGLPGSARRPNRPRWLRGFGGIPLMMRFNRMALIASRPVVAQPASPSDLGRPPRSPTVPNLCAVPVGRVVSHRWDSGDGQGPGRRAYLRCSASQRAAPAVPTRRRPPSRRGAPGASSMLMMTAQGQGGYAATLMG